MGQSFPLPGVLAEGQKVNIIDVGMTFVLFDGPLEQFKVVSTYMAVYLRQY